MNTCKAEKILSFQDDQNDQSVKLTKMLMEQYRQSLVERGFKEQTIRMYTGYIYRLYMFLEGEGELTDENLKRWIKYLTEQGYSARTINLNISSLNGLLRYCGKKKVPVDAVSVSQSMKLPELDRNEYLQVLSYAKEHCSWRDYLLVKTLATIDISVSGLCFLTVEACRSGVTEAQNHHEVIIPHSLQQELLAFIEKQKLETGSIFISNRGNQLDRSNITHRIETIAEAAGIEPGECTPRSLHRLYEKTQEGISQHLMTLHRQVYEKLLDEEKKIS